MSGFWAFLATLLVDLAKAIREWFNEPVHGQIGRGGDAMRADLDERLRQAIANRRSGRGAGSSGSAGGGSGGGADGVGSGWPVGGEPGKNGDTGRLGGMVSDNRNHQ